LKLATPETAFFVVVPLRVPLPGFIPIATVIDAMDEVTVFPKLSWTVTEGGPAIVFPAVEFPGAVV
jgi:hypothetical protein